jgi:hypothetical protein
MSGDAERIKSLERQLEAARWGLNTIVALPPTAGARVCINVAREALDRLSIHRPSSARHTLPPAPSPMSLEDARASVSAGAQRFGLSMDRAVRETDNERA